MKAGTCEGPKNERAELNENLARLRSRLVGLLPAGRGSPQPPSTGRLETAPHSELLLAAVEELARTTAKAAATGTERTPVEGGAQFQRNVANCGQLELAECVKQRGVATPRVLLTIRPCFPVKWKRRSTAGCGKPHVRWCGRVVPGRNPRHSTQSAASAAEPVRIQIGILEYKAQADGFAGQFADIYPSDPTDNPFQRVTKVGGAIL